MSDSLSQVIDAAWEDRNAVGAGNEGRGSPRRRQGHRRARQRRGAHCREDRRRVGRPPVAEEGGPAVFPAESRWSSSPALRAVPTGGTRFRPSSRACGEKEFEAAGFRAVPGAHRPPRRLCRARRGPDAELRQHRRPRRRRDDGRHLGDGRKLRADRPQRPYFGRRGDRRRARAAPGRTGHHRGRLLHRSALGSRRGCHRRAGRGAVDGRIPRRIDQDRRPRVRRGPLRPRARLFGGRSGRSPGKDGGPALACAVIVKRVDERTRSKTSINELLRD